MNVREREIESYLVNEVTALGGECHKFIPDVVRGMPDRLCLMPGGAVFWVELKKPKGGVLAPHQRHRHKCLRELGQVVYVAWTKQDVDDILDKWKTPINR